MSTILSIDTSNNKEATVGLLIEGKEFNKTQALNTRKAQLVLPLAQELLEEHHLTLQDITEIRVNTGPGSFTGLRVGVTIANTLGYILKVPINGKKIGELADAHYKE